MIYFLYFAFLFVFSSCEIEESPPLYNLNDIQGNWVVIYYHSDKGPIRDMVPDFTYWFIEGNDLVENEIHYVIYFEENSLIVGDRSFDVEYINDYGMKIHLKDHDGWFHLYIFDSFSP